MKKLRILFIIVVGLFLYSIGLSALVRNIYLSQDQGKRWGVASDAVRFMAEFPTTVKKVLDPPEFFIPNSGNQDGLTATSNLEDSVYGRLLVSYKEAPFQQRFDLINLSDGQVIQSWDPDNAALFDKAYNPGNPRVPPKDSDLYFMHPLLMEDGSLIFNSQLTSLLVRVNSNGEILWLNNDRTYHHTSELDSEGKLWACTRPFSASAYPFLPEGSQFESSLLDDTITQIDPDNGEILFDKAVLEILLENGLESLVIQKGQLISDPLHLNDIQPALTDSPYWQKGDLLLSCRNISTVFLYRPSTNTVLWYKQGPWQNQHDADFVNLDQISIFGNNIIREESTLDPKVGSKNLYFPRNRPHNEVYLYDFAKDSILTPYTRLLSEERIRTITSGRSEILPNGDLFIEDTNNGRIIFGDSLSKKAEYVKRIDPEHISSLFWSRIIH